MKIHNVFFSLSLFVLGHQQNANTNASASPPLTAQPSPLTPEHQHRELDELISDMMLTVESIPDLKPHSQINTQTSTSITTTTTTSINSGSGASNTNPGQNFTIIDENVRFIDEDDDKNIPYHARQDSRPFTYGTMIGESKGLSSPSLVRKASFNKSTGDTLKKVQTQVFPDFNTSNNGNQSKYNTLQSTTSTYKRDPIDDIFTDSALNYVNDHHHQEQQHYHQYQQQQQQPQPYKREFREEFYKEEVKHYDPLKRSYTDGTLRKSPEKINTYKTSSSVVTSPYSDTESLSPPREFRNNTKSPEFHET